MPVVNYKKLESADKNWATEFIKENWGSNIVIAHNKQYEPAALNGFYAEIENIKVGLVTYIIENENCEIVTLDSKKENIGIGSALIILVKEEALKNNCRKIWLITTNDNLKAISFYQKRGFHLIKVYPGTIEKYRLIKKEIPLTGDNGIPIRDELEFELIL